MYCNNREAIHFSVLEYPNNTNVHVAFKIPLKNSMHIVFHAMFVFHLFTQGDPGEYSVSPVSLEVIFKRNINQLL